MRSRNCDQPAPAHGGADCTDTVVSVSGPLGQQRRKCGEESCSQGKHGLEYLIFRIIPKKNFGYEISFTFNLFPLFTNFAFGR